MADNILCIIQFDFKALDKIKTYPDWLIMIKTLIEMPHEVDISDKYKRKLKIILKTIGSCNENCGISKGLFFPPPLSTMCEYLRKLKTGE